MIILKRFRVFCFVIIVRDPISDSDDHYLHNDGGGAVTSGVDGNDVNSSSLWQLLVISD